MYARAPGLDKDRTCGSSKPFSKHNLRCPVAMGKKTGTFFVWLRLKGILTQKKGEKGHHWATGQQSNDFAGKVGQSVDTVDTVDKT